MVMRLQNTGSAELAICDQRAYFSAAHAKTEWPSCPGTCLELAHLQFASHDMRNGASVVFLERSLWITSGMRRKHEEPASLDLLRDYAA
jgi:hypothetical protein